MFVLSDLGLSATDTPGVAAARALDHLMSSKDMRSQVNEVFLAADLLGRLFR